MRIYFFSRSTSLKKHISKMHFGVNPVQVCAPKKLTKPDKVLVLIHTSSIKECRDIVKKLDGKSGIMIGIASDIPDVHQFLKLSDWNIRCYFNSFMAEIHYHQMFSMIEAGQKWIVPEVLEAALKLARETENTKKNKVNTKNSVYDKLTKKEQQVAFWVAKCLSNKEIAREQNVTERTIKSHLTRIYEKLGIRDRTALVAKLNQG